MNDLKFIIPILFALASVCLQLYSLGRKHGYEKRDKEIEKSTFDFEKENKP